MSDKEIIEQIQDEQGTALPNDLMTIKEYAESIGQTYENIRKKVARLKQDPDFKDHIIVMSNPETSQPMTYIDKHIQDYLNSHRRTDPIVIMSDSEMVQKLELELNEVKADRDKQREEKEAYMKQLLELKSNPPNTIDTSQYILIEDHQKKLEELEEKSSKLEEENADLKNEQENIKKEAEKKQEEIQKELTAAETNLNKITSEKMILEAEKSKIEAEAEIQKMKAAQELEEALKLGFFARRKKLKELKARQENGNQ